MQRPMFYTALVCLIVPSGPLYAQDLFGFHTDYFVLGGKSPIFPGDVDGDGTIDIALPTSLGVAVLYNHGDGTFAAQANIRTWAHAPSVSIADLDGDGANDLALIQQRASAVSVLSNNRDGSFSLKAECVTDDRPRSLFITDLDGDGDSDLAVANGGAYPDPGSVSVLLNLSDRSTDVAQHEERSSDIPGISALSQSYPNPFNSETAIRYQLSVRSRVDISVYNLMGQRIAALVDMQMNAGSYSVVWDGRHDSGATAASGIYLYRMQAGGLAQTKKLVLIR